MRFFLTSAFSLKDICHRIDHLLPLCVSLVYYGRTQGTEQNSLLLCSLTLAEKTWNSDLSLQGQMFADDLYTPSLAQLVGAWC